MQKMARIEAKLEFLRLVMEHKQVLFGSFSDTLTKADKTNTWKKIHERAQALALVPQNKDYTYTRDTLWQNMKKTAMKKRDNSRATGTGASNFTKIDLSVFDIIGKETPNMDGLAVNESMVTVQLTEETKEIPQYQPTMKKTKKPTNKVNIRNAQKEKLQLKKLKLTIKLLEKENYLRKLQIKELEQKLNINATNNDMSSDEKENTQPTNYGSDIGVDEEYLDSDFE